jgi:hypothetical protein
MALSMTAARRRLSVVWFTGAGLLFLVMIVQTVFDHYGSDAEEAWGWLLPGILPTLSLIIGVLVMDALGKSVKAAAVDGFMFWTAFGLSVFYLLMVALPILLQPFTGLEPLTTLKQSNLWLGPMQGLVSAALAAFFVKSETSPG